MIEIDGEYHSFQEQIKKDRERTQILESNGLQIIRFTNNEIKENLDKIILEITLKTDEILHSQNSGQSH